MKFAPSVLVVISLLASTAVGQVFLQARTKPGGQPLRADQSASYWDLQTGSRIAYLHYPAKSPTKQTPVVFLHGGPGAFAVDHDPDAEHFFQQIAASGFDVYLYDQFGSGKSSRTRDPREYTVRRQVADLEAIRTKIGAKKLILIGESWGAILAAHYIVTYPDRCAKVIFDAPGALDQRELQVASIDPDAATVKEVEKWTSDFNARHKRMLEILHEDPVAAYKVVPETELDAEFDGLLNRLLPTLVCANKLDPAVLSARPAHGMGWWVNTMISADLGSRAERPSAKLRNNRTPALILRGGCDYIRSEAAYQYKATFPNSTLLAIPQAGHWLVRDQPEIYFSAIRSFLLGQPLQMEVHDSKELPPR